MPYISNGDTWGSSATQWDNSAAMWDALTAGDAPDVTVHADAGVGATVDIDGNRHDARVTITTGASPVSGGTLATFALQGYADPPYSDVSPRDETAAAAIPIIDAPTNEIAVLTVAGELEPSTAYRFKVCFGGF